MVKKVLFLATVESHILNFHIPYIKYIQSLGYEVHVAAKYANRVDEIIRLGAIYHDIKFSRSPFSLSNIKAFVELNYLFATHKFDLIHVHTPIASFLGRLSAKIKNNGPIIYTAHGFHFYNGASCLAWLLYYNLEKVARKWTDYLIVINKEDFKNAQCLGYKAEQNLYFVNGVGVDLTIFSEKNYCDLKENLTLNNETLIVSCIAELNSNKNQIFLLKAWKRIIEKFPNAQLLLIGSGATKTNLEMFIKRENILQVSFLGYRDDIADLLHITDIVTLVSKREGLPKCILEAMAAAKPVVATNVRGSRDLVEHGLTGFLINDEDELVHRLEELLDDKILREKMGGIAKSRVEIYSIENVLNQVGKIYQKALRCQKQ